MPSLLAGEAAGREEQQPWKHVRHVPKSFEVAARHVACTRPETYHNEPECPSALSWCYGLTSDVENE